uniref:HYR domain-containing protein n=1 Tax=Cyclobacterium salsum TaxID=2666329 RepID=UPI0013920869
VKIDGSGNKVWDKTIGGNNTDFLRSTTTSPDGGYLLAGYSNSSASGDKSENNKGGWDYWVVKLQEVLEDNEAPVIEAIAPITVSTDAGTCVASVPFSATATDNSDASVSPEFSILVDGVSTAITSPHVFPLGQTEVYVNATDAAGNVAAQQSFMVTVEDNEAPVLATNNITVNLDANGQAAIAVADIYDPANSSDNCAIDETSLVLDISNFSCSNVGTPVEVTLSGSDVNGNSSSTSATVTVMDNEAPVLATNDITVNLDANGQAAIAVADIYDPANSSDNCAIDETSLVLDISSFSCRNVGTPVEVTLSGKDVNNNSSSTSATVTVMDNEAPVLATNDITVNLDANGQAAIAVADIYDPANSSDNCAIDETSLVLDISSFSCRNVGTPVEVTLSGKDVNNNSSSTSATVTVMDNLAPLAAAKDITVELDASGEATITALDVDNGSSDNCDLSLEVDITSFNCGDVGENTVVLTATDGSGNSSTASATVTVVDNLAPTVVPPANITVTNDPESCNAIVDLGQAIVNDNCAGVQLSNNAPAKFPIGQTTVTWTAVDASGNQSQAYQDVNVTNAVPVISGSLVAPVDPNPVGSPVTIIDVVTDNNIASVEWHWSDGLITTGTFIYDATTGTNTVSGQRTFNTAELYTVSLVVTDHCGETAAYTYSNLIVIFDPNGEFVTGGGWIDSPAGASEMYPNAVGKANFGFVSKYKRGANIPTGNTEFQFKAGDLNFKSTSYDWLVVAGHSAKFKGEGTVNGVGQYGFMLSAVDGKLKGDGLDRFRIKIWDNDGVIYDNEMGASDEAESTTVIGGGSVVIHKGKSGKNARFDVSETAGRTKELENPEGPVTLNLQLYPNPLQEKLFIDMESNMDEVVSISIFSMEGRLIHEEKQSIVQGSNTIILEVSRWKATTDQLLLRLMSPSTGFHHFVLLKP